MIGTLHGSPAEIVAEARAIFNAVSPLGRVRLSEGGSEIVFETPWAKGVLVERYELRDGLAKELVRHAGVLSLKASVYEAAGRA